jgi:wyosine [tRNA(Phe)-imidazoG37] synthetase (radical SAM superfamily)
MDKKTPKSKKDQKKIVELRSAPQPKDIFTPCTDPNKLDKLQKIIAALDIYIISVMTEKVPACYVGLKGVTKEIKHFNPYAVTGPKEPIIPVRTTNVYAIDYVEEPTYIKASNARKQWAEELYKNKIYQTKKKFWENLGVKYIIDYDINSINRALQE